MTVSRNDSYCGVWPLNICRVYSGAWYWTHLSVTHGSTWTMPTSNIVKISFFCNYLVDSRSTLILSEYPISWRNLNSSKVYYSCRNREVNLYWYVINYCWCKSSNIFTNHIGIVVSTVYRLSIIKRLKIMFRSTRYCISTR